MPGDVEALVGGRQAELRGAGDLRGERDLPRAPFPAVTSISIGYLPCSADWGGVAVTFTSVVAPASTVTVWARSSALGDAVTCQPWGADGSKANVCDAGVSFVIVKL